MISKNEEESKYEIRITSKNKMPEEYPVKQYLR